MEIQTGSQSSEASEQEVINPDYATQFFGFTPYSVVDEVFNIILAYTKDAVRAAHHYLSKKLTYIPKERLRQGSENLKKSTMDAFEKHINKLELFQLKNIFHVPAYMVLPEDQVHLEKRVTSIKEKDLDKDLEELRAKISTSIHNITKLRARNDDVQIALTRYQQFVDTFAEMDALLEAAGVTELDQSIIEHGEIAQQLTSISSQEKLDTDD